MNYRMRLKNFLPRIASQETRKSCFLRGTFLSSLLLGLLVTPSLYAQESPYARVAIDKSPAIIYPKTITPDQLGPWMFGMTLGEALQKSDCNKDYKTRSPLGHSLKEPYLYCKVWISPMPSEPVKKPLFLWLYFKENRLSRLELILGEIETRSEATLLFQRALQFWKQLQPADTTLDSNTHSAHATFPTIADIEQSLTTKAKSDRGQPEVSLRALGKLPEAQLVFREDLVYFTLQQPLPRIHLDPQEINEHHIGPWRLGMSQTTVLQNPACRKAGIDPQEKTERLDCNAWLKSIGPQTIYLWFTSDKLITVQFQTHLEKEWDTPATAERFISQGLAFVHPLQDKYPIYVNHQHKQGRDRWLQGPFTSSFLLKQITPNTKNLFVYVSTPHRILLDIDPQERTVIWNIHSLAIEKNITLLEPHMIKPGEVGPWKRGMHVQEAVKVSGCTDATIPSANEPLPETYKLYCEVALPGQEEPGSLELWFLHNQLSAAHILVSRFYSKDIANVQVYADYALRFFQAIAPKYPLSAWSTNRGFAQPLPVPINSAWMGQVIQTEFQKGASQKPDVIQVKFQEETYNAFGLQLAKKDTLWILHDMLSTEQKGTNWMVESTPTMRILISPAEVAVNRIGPWRLADPIDTASSHRACEEREGRTKEEKGVHCNVWLQGWGACQSSLYFYKNRLRQIALAVYKKRNDGSNNNTNPARIWSWFQKITRLSPFRIAVTTEQQILWQTKHFPLDSFLRSWPQNPSRTTAPSLPLQATASLVSVIPLKAPRFALAFFPKKGTIEMNLVDLAAIRESLTLGSAASFHDQGIGPWNIGMTPAQVLAQPGCQNAAEEPTETAHTTFASCPVQFETVWEPSDMRFWFENGKLHELSLFVFVGPLHNPDSFQEQTTFALQRLQQLSPVTPLEAFVKENGKRIYQAASVTPEWIGAKNNEQLHKKGTHIEKEVFIHFKDRKVHPHLFLKIDAESGIRFSYLSDPNG